VRDDEVIAAADELGLSMVFTGVRHFATDFRRVKLLVIGSGGREHGDRVAPGARPRVQKVFVARQWRHRAQAGLENVAISAIDKLAEFALPRYLPHGGGTRVPLAEGIVDLFRSKGLRISARSGLRPAGELQTFAKDS